MSRPTRLSGHYDAKYGSEASAPLDQVLESGSHPTNRFEACIDFFLKHFHGGDVLELGAGSGLVARSLIAHGLQFTTYTVSELSHARLKGLAQTLRDSRIRML